MLGSSGGNLGVSTGPDGVFPIDDPLAPLTEQIRAAIAKLSPEPIRFVLNAHWHGDHSGGNENLGRSGTLILAHHQVRAQVVTARPSRSFDAEFGKGFIKPDDFVALVYVRAWWRIEPRDRKGLAYLVLIRGVYVIVDITRVGDSPAMDPTRTARPMDSDSSPPPRRVAMVAFPDIQLLDVVGPLEVLAAASLAAAHHGVGRGYALEVIGPELTSLRAASGLRIGVDRTYSDRPESLDTLIVAGGIGSRRAAHDRRLLDYVVAADACARRVCSVCTGAGILAAAGLLAGRRVTTHWAWAATLAAGFPDVEVDPDAIYCKDGRVWTSAGVTAGLDLALALVEDDLGRDLALEVSRQMVFFLKRPGGQAQFSAQPAIQIAARDPLRDLQTWIVEHPAEDLSIEQLAARVAMSPRHFSRVFRAEVGRSPGRFVESVRVEAARRQLEESKASVEQIAERVGLGRGETMRRAFLRQLGVGPAAYRDRFSPPRNAAGTRVRTLASATGESR